MKKALLVLVGLLVLAGVSGALAWRSALAPASATEDEQAFVVPPGANLSGVARALEDAGLVKSAFAFEWLGRYRDAGADLRAGEYLLSPHLPAEDLLGRLTRGEVRTYTVSIPEGLTLVEIAARFEEAGFAEAEAFLALARDPAFVAELGLEGETLEGYLHPETYRWARGVATRNLLLDMVEQYRDVWRPLAGKAKERGLSDREALILASIVEKETGAPEERPLIAGVFLNRLARGMRLETDPSVIYGIEGFDGNLRRVHLEDESNPYNTYRIPALPPGPIANPGGEALRAVVEPAETEALFFVSRNDGTHHFSRTYAEHSRMVDCYQRKRGCPQGTR